MKLWIAIGDITEFGGDAIVNPANTLGLMGGGVALAIKKKGGDVIEEEARRRAPIPIGSAIATTAGKLKCKYVIHAPTVEKPGSSSSPDKVYLATKASIQLAEKLGIKSIAFPLMGAGVGGLTPQESLRTMLKALVEFKELDIDVYIYLRSPELLNAAKSVLSEFSIHYELVKQN